MTDTPDNPTPDTPAPDPKLKLAIEALHQAVGQGNAEARYRLGMLYANGEGVELDQVKGAELVAAAAKQGHAAAQATLGWMYANGYGVNHDDAQARTWYQRAADKGDIKAAYTLGTIYRFGQLGVEKNGEQAVHWYLIAANQGLAAAQFALGRLLMDGKLVPQDEATALQWLSLAHLNGSSKAEETIETLIRRMDPAVVQQVRDTMLAQARQGAPEQPD
jgi:TPR repeat protein